MTEAWCIRRPPHFGTKGQYARLRVCPETYWCESLSGRLGSGSSVVLGVTPSFLRNESPDDGASCPLLIGGVESAGVVAFPAQRRGLSLREAQIAGALCTLRDLLQRADAAESKQATVSVDELNTVIFGFAAAIRPANPGADT